MRREHIQAEGAEKRRDPGAAHQKPQRGQGRPGGADFREPAAGALGHPAVWQPGGESRRLVPGGVHWADEGHRPLRRGPGGAVLHLRGAHDYRGGAAVFAGQQLRAGQPFPAGHGLQGHPVQGAPDRPEEPGAHRGGDRPGALHEAGGRGAGPGGHCGACLPVRAGVLRRGRHHLYYGPGGRPHRRRGLAGGNRREAGHPELEPPGEENPLPAVFGGLHPGGGGGADWHLPGPGVPAGEGGAEQNQRGAAQKKKKTGRRQPQRAPFLFTSFRALSGKPGPPPRSPGTWPSR